MISGQCASLFLPLSFLPTTENLNRYMADFTQVTSDPLTRDMKSSLSLKEADNGLIS